MKRTSAQCTYCKERGHWAQECPNKWKLEVGNSRSWENSKGISPGGRQCLGRMGFRSPPQGNSEWRGNPLNSWWTQGLNTWSFSKPMVLFPKKKSWVQGATGTKMYSWTTQRTVDLGMGQVSHSFMVIPDCPYPLLGQDLLSKVGAQIHFLLDGPQLTGPKGEPMHGRKTSLTDPARSQGYLVYRQEQFSP